MKSENLLKNFNDIPLHFPLIIKQILKGENGQRDFNRKIEKIKKGAEDGLRPTEAIMWGFGIPKVTAKTWKKWGLEELETNRTDTPLTKILLAASKTDIEYTHRLRQKRTEKIFEEDNEQMLREALKERNDTPEKKEIELSSDDQGPVVFNIKPMTPLEENDT